MWSTICNFTKKRTLSQIFSRILLKLSNLLFLGVSLWWLLLLLCYYIKAADTISAALTNSSKTILNFNKWNGFTRNWLAWNLKEENTHRENTCSTPISVLHLIKKSKTLDICWFSLSSSSSPPLFRNIRKFRAQKYFTDHHTAITIQLLVAIKGIFSGLFFF